MRHSIWKLTALVGISGLGFLALLQVQKSLHDTGTAEAAEIAPGDLGKTTQASRKAKTASSPPGRVRLSDAGKRENASLRVAADAEQGLDFRERLPRQATLESETTGLTRTAEVELKSVPQRRAEPKPIIAPASFESSSPTPQEIEKEPRPSNDEPRPAAPQEPEPAAFGDDFGPDPFADLEPLAPNAEAADLAEPSPQEPTLSPGEQLEQDDPFAEAPAEPKPESSLETAPVEPAAVPLEAEPRQADWLTDLPAEPVQEPDLAEGSPEPATEPEPAQEPLPPADGAEMPAEEQGEPAPEEAPETDAFDFDFGDPADDPFGAEPSPADTTPMPTEAMPEPAAETEPAAEQLESEQPVPEEPQQGGPTEAPPVSSEPEIEPAPETEDIAPFPSEPDSQQPSDSVIPETDSPSTQPAPDRQPVPETDPFGDDQRPGLLPADDPADTNGSDTVSPDSPRGPQHARLTVEKKAPPRAVLGEPLVYEIVVTNVGDSAAHDVTISDVVPRGAELQGTIPRAEMTRRTLVWKYETLAPKQSQTIKIKVTPTEAGSIGSVATVNFVSEVAASTEVVAPRLSLKVTAPPQVPLGQPVDLRFEISNVGSAPAEKVLLRNLLPEGFRHSDGSDLEYEVGTLAPGATENVVLRVATTKAGQFTNNAILTASGGLKTEAAAAVEVAAPKISVTRQGPKRRYVGRPAMFANVIRNTTGETARDVKVVEQIPAGMDFVEASHNGEFDPATRTITWRLAAIQPAQEISLQVVLTATTEGVQDSLVKIQEAGSGSIELASSTTVQGLPSLAPTMQGSEKPIIVGERTAFRIRIKNRGNAEAEGVEIDLGLPTQVKFIEATGGEASTDAEGVTTVKLPAPIAVGEEQVVEMVVEGATPGTARFRTAIKASHMAEPLVRDEELIVLAPRS